MRYCFEKTDYQHVMALRSDGTWTDRRQGVRMPRRGGIPSTSDSMLFWDLINIPGVVEIMAYPDRLHFQKAMLYEWVDILWQIDECLKKHSREFRELEKTKPDPDTQEFLW